MHYIYKITNLINNKIYIGQTNDPADRWSKHKSSAKRNLKSQLITKAISKYGANNFIFEVIATCNSLENVNYLEVEVIKQYNSRDPSVGYNVAIGGNHQLHTLEVRKKISNGLQSHHGRFPGKYKGRQFSQQWKDKLSVAATGKPGTNKNKKFSKEWKKKISDSISNKENKKARRFNQEIEKEICQLYSEKNYSTYKLSKIYNCYRSLISNILDRNVINKRQSSYSENTYKNYRFTKEVEIEICNLYQSGNLTRTEIGVKYDCRTNVITAILKRNNII